MRPTHPVELLVCAIATKEGWFSDGTIPQIYNNPGDLRFAGQHGATRPRPAVNGVEPIAAFPSKALGIAALYRDIWAKVVTGVTVRQLIAEFAPPNENDTSVYLQNALHWTGLPADVPVLELLPPLVALNAAT